ncbi:unnamed protein product [Hydatigera taeniaeformis]|uniref:Uncharacterized protein n=1 Tax=Hydatigena taeniaeformis TaxID=6205 RepID=A0A0R3WJH6_HYDTA|nr:unnamed protein product [Hydatigera taeniaeformis]
MPNQVGSHYPSIHHQSNGTDVSRHCLPHRLHLHAASTFLPSSLPSSLFASLPSITPSRVPLIHLSSPSKSATPHRRMGTCYACISTVVDCAACESDGFNSIEVLTGEEERARLSQWKLLTHTYHIASRRRISCAIAC